MDSTSGVLLIDKPAGPSSAHVLKLVSRQLQLPKNIKIGHAGTLDPFATGLLVVLLDKACRLADYFQIGEKVYSGEVKLGLATDTDDITGNIISESASLPTFAEIQNAANFFKGKILQMPPSISALKVNGKRAYQLKRAGIEPELHAREVNLRDIEISEVAGDSFIFQIKCSKGFYVRSLARDIGQKLGCGACLKTLRREFSAPFSVAEAASIESLTDLRIPAFMSLDNALSLLSFEEILVADTEFERLRNGLLPLNLMATFSQKLDSYGQGLLVYKRNSDRLAGGLIRLSKSGISIQMNF